MNTKQRIKNILVVEDDTVFRERLVKAFLSRGFMSFGAKDSREAMFLTSKETPSHIVLDLKLSEESGLDLIDDLLKLSPGAKIVMLTGYGSIATALCAVKKGAVNYLTKPANADEILLAFNEAQEDDKQDFTLRVPSLQLVEWEHMQRVLTECGGNISKTAKLLRMHRRTLQRKLEKFPPNA